MTKRPDAAVLLIGNELLSGRVRDENLHFLAGELWSLGVPVRVASVIRDGIDQIAASTRDLSQQHTYLFTTGGIGPTHDDVTIEGVARGFGVPVVQHPELERLIRNRLGDDVTEPHLKMARAPQGAELEGTDGGHWPTIRVGNTYILPGVPSILRTKFERLKESFRFRPLFRTMLGLATTETKIATHLDQMAARFPAVEIGSYPQSEFVLVTFEGECEDEVELARTTFDSETSSIPRHSAS